MINKYATPPTTNLPVSIFQCISRFFSSFPLTYNQRLLWSEQIEGHKFTKWARRWGQMQIFRLFLLFFVTYKILKFHNVKMLLVPPLDLQVFLTKMFEAVH